jgi:transposase
MSPDGDVFLQAVLEHLADDLSKLTMNARRLGCRCLALASKGGCLMRGRRPEELTIARQDQDALHSVAHNGSLPWFQVQRAKIVLAIAAGERCCSVAARLECDEATVWRACQRYRRDGLASLFADDRQGNSGRPPQFFPGQRVQIVSGGDGSIPTSETDTSGCGRLRELIGHSPREFGKNRSIWTLRLIAEVCFEVGIVEHRVSPSTVCRTLRHMGIRWKRAKLWLTSPDPQYALKKARRDQLIEEAAKHPDWVLGFEDEVWWNRLTRPRVSAWTAGPPLKIHVLKAEEEDPDPVAICCYGFRRHDTKKVLVRFMEGRPSGGYTIAFLEWLSYVLTREGKRKLVVVWDDASWHASEMAVAWIEDHNRRVNQEGGVEITHFELPVGSPWLNNIEPCWPHAKRAIVEPDRKLTAQETTDRVCQYFGCEPLPYLKELIPVGS